MSTSDPGEGAPKQSRPARDNYHHGDLRRMLIAAGREMIVRDGPAALSLREVARALGVSHNAPYRHFPGRDALLAAIAAAGFVSLRQALMAAAQASPDIRLTELGKAYIRFALDHRADFLLMFGSELSKADYPELKEAAEAAFNALRQTVPGDPAPDLEERAIRAWALAHGLAHLVVDGQLSFERALLALGGSKPAQGSS